MVNKVEKKEDLKTGIEFNSIFFKTFKDSIPGIEVNQNVKFRDFIDYGATAIYTTEISLENWKNKKKKTKAGLMGSSIRGMLWVTSSINPNGISGKNDIARAYTIQYELKGNRRVSQRRWGDSCFIKFYGFERDIDSIIEEFQYWIDTNFSRFLSDIENKNYDWKNDYK